MVGFSNEKVKEGVKNNEKEIQTLAYYEFIAND